jgi:hypothetical protein
LAVRTFCLASPWFIPLFTKKKGLSQMLSFLHLRQTFDVFYRRYLSMKQSLRDYEAVARNHEALAHCLAMFTRMKRST